MRRQALWMPLFALAITPAMVLGQIGPEPPAVPPAVAPPVEVPPGLAPPVEVPQEFAPFANVPQPMLLGPPRAMGINRPPSLNDLVLAKMDLNKETPRVIMMIESFRTEKKKVKVTMFKPEQREREVKVGDKTVTQTYTVNVPVIEEREVNTKVPAGRKPKSIEAKDVQFFSLAGEPVSVDDAGRILTQLRPVFLLDRGAQPQPLPAIVKQAMREDCLIVVTKQAIREAPHVHAAWVAPNALPLQPIPALVAPPPALP